MRRVYKTHNANSGVRRKEKTQIPFSALSSFYGSAYTLRSFSFTLSCSLHFHRFPFWRSAITVYANLANDITTGEHDVYQFFRRLAFSFIPQFSLPSKDKTVSSLSFLPSYLRLHLSVFFVRSFIHVVYSVISWQSR